MNKHTKFNAFHKPALFTTLLIAVLISSLFTCIFVNNSIGASLKNAIHVKNETELKNAITNTPSKTTTIALDNDITLTDALTIPANKDITLTSNKVSGYYKLNGATNQSTITVETSGVLKLDACLTKEAF